MKNEIKTWKVYAEVPKHLWDEFKEKCNVLDIDQIMEKALEREIGKYDKE